MVPSLGGLTCRDDTPKQVLPKDARFARLHYDAYIDRNTGEPSAVLRGLVPSPAPWIFLILTLTLGGIATLALLSNTLENQNTARIMNWIAFASAGLCSLTALVLLITQTGRRSMRSFDEFFKRRGGAYTAPYCVDPYAPVWRLKPGASAPAQRAQQQFQVQRVQQGLPVSKGPSDAVRQAQPPAQRPLPSPPSAPRAAVGASEYGNIFGSANSPYQMQRAYSRPQPQPTYQDFLVP